MVVTRQWTCAAAFLILILVLLAGCATPVKTEHEPGVDFSAYQSFAWVPPERPVIREPIFDSEILDRRVELAVSEVLEEQGLRRVADAAEADLLVTYHGVVRRSGQAGGSRVSLGMGTARSGGSTRIGIGTGISVGGGGGQREQSLIILDLRDASDDRLVWRGWREEDARQDRYTQDRLKRLVRRILAEYPPEED